MDHNKEPTPVASPPTDATVPTLDATSTTPAPETTANATTPTIVTTTATNPVAEEQVQVVTPDAQPPKYEEYAR